MKPEDALRFLDQTVSDINGSRQFHFQLQQAIGSLQALLPKNETPPKKETPSDVKS